MNAAAPLVSEYIRKQTLRKLGYVFDPNGLDVFTAECFEQISGEISKLEAEEMKAARRKR